MEATILEEKPDTGVTLVNGKAYRADAKGNLVPVEAIKAAHLLEDETVRKISGYARDLSDQVSRFKQHTFDDLAAFEALLAQEYGGKVGGAKGNKTFMTFDGLQKVLVQVQDRIDFGPQLQVAKGLLDECFREWSDDSRAEVRAIFTDAFNVDKAGQIDRSRIFLMLRYDFADERWQRAMQAIRDAMRVVGSKIYVRCYERDRPDAEWRAVTIDLAKA